MKNKIIYIKAVDKVDFSNRLFIFTILILKKSNFRELTSKITHILTIHSHFLKYNFPIFFKKVVCQQSDLYSPDLFFPLAIEFLTTLKDGIPFYSFKLEYQKISSV